MARILIVDDDDVWTVLLARRLEREGHQVDYDLSAESALTRLQQPNTGYEILLLDHRLGPGMDGVELLRQARAANPTIDAVLFTGLDEPGVGLLAYQAGAYRYLHKPFEPQELILIIQSLLDWRETHYERDWLRILNSVVEQLQKASTVQEVGQILVEGGVTLGFDRARFYLARPANEELTLFGVCQSGVSLAQGFEDVVQPLAQTRYCRAAAERKEPTFFRDRELGRSFLSDLTHGDGQPESLGEWVSVPLYSGDECIGFLNMDNCSRAREIPPQKKDLLRLFAGQAAGAVRRALRAEREQNERQAEDLARTIIHQMGDPAAPDALDRLLLAIREHFLWQGRDDNFIVTLQDRQSGWYRYRLHIESNVRETPSWCAPTRGGLIEYVMKQDAPLFLAAEAAAFRAANGIPQVGAKPARSWMGAPLRVGDDVVGAMVLENDHRDHAFHQRQFDLLVFLANRLAAVIQSAWLYEQERQYSDLLRLLQQASELIAGSDEDKLWLTTLTLCTAHYGAGFDRAMLFLAEEGGARLRGRLAIGHLEQEEAEADWEEMERTGTDWIGFLGSLRTGSIKPTPLDKAVREYSFTVSNGAFTEALRENKVVSLTIEEARNHLPAEFLQRFGVTGYCLVPAKAADRVLGIVVLDNIWGKDPNRVGVLDVLDNMTNQAALLHENIRQTRATEQLIAVQHQVLVQAGERPLQETLQAIAEAIRNIAAADLVGIYTLQDAEGELRYDHRSAARVGRRNQLGPRPHRSPSCLSRYALLESKRPVLIGDVVDDQTLFCGERHGDTAIVKEEGIRATIAAPVYGLRTGAPRAMLYIDYRTLRRFADYDSHMAEAFAHLIATAIGNWRHAQGLRDTQEARDKELTRLGEVLEGALAADVDEHQIAQLLLDAVPSLFNPLPVTTGITLKEWQRTELSGEPTELHRFIYPKESSLKERLDPSDDNTGIIGRAIRTGEVQNVPDVTKDPDYKPRDKDTQSELDVPIWVDGHVVGALNIESPQLAGFTKHHEEMGQRFADVAALAIGNVRRQRNLRTVLTAASALTGPTTFQETLDSIAAEIRQVIPNLSLMVIWYLDLETRRPRLGSYFGVSKAAIRRESPRKAGAVQKGLTLAEPHYQPDVATDPLFRDRSFVKGQGIASTAIFPLRVEGKAVGVMFFSYRHRHEFTHEETRLYPVLAQVVASSINDALQLHQTERERKRLWATQRVTEVISASANAERVIDGVRKTLESLYPRCTVYIARYNQRTGRLDLPTERTPHLVTASSDPDCFPCQLAVESLRTGKKELKVKRHTRHGDKSRPLRSTTRVSLGATLVTGGDKGSGRLLGVLVLESHQEDAFDRDDEEIIRNVARQTRIALERFEQEANDRFQKNFIYKFYSATPIIHDINQYTGRVLRRVERLQREPELTDSGRQTLSELLDQTLEMSNRVTSRDLRREELVPVSLSVELPRWIEETLSERSAPIRLHRDLTPDITVYAYPKALRRAFYDLTRNAMEAMGFEAEDQQLSVSAQLGPNSGEVEVRIHNNGPVIPVEVRSLLFSDVYSSKGDERGIGLLYVRAAVERMGGAVWLDSSTEEDGTTFVVRLKVAGPRDGNEGDQ